MGSKIRNMIELGPKRKRPPSFLIYLGSFDMQMERQRKENPWL